PPVLPCSPLFPYTTLFRSEVARPVAPLEEVVEVELGDLGGAADEPHVPERAELGRPSGAEERVRDRRERTQRVGTGLADLADHVDRKSTRLNSSHQIISYA